RRGRDGTFRFGKRQKLDDRGAQQHAIIGAELDFGDALTVDKRSVGGPVVAQVYLSLFDGKSRVRARDHIFYKNHVAFAGSSDDIFSPFFEGEFSALVFAGDEFEYPGRILYVHEQPQLDVVKRYRRIELPKVQQARMTVTEDLRIQNSRATRKIRDGSAMQVEPRGFFLYVYQHHRIFAPIGSKNPP